MSHHGQHCTSFPVTASAPGCFSPPKKPRLAAAAAGQCATSRGADRRLRSPPRCSLPLSLSLRRLSPRVVRAPAVDNDPKTLVTEECRTTICAEAWANYLQVRHLQSAFAGCSCSGRRRTLARRTRRIQCGGAPRGSGGANGGGASGRRSSRRGRRRSRAARPLPHSSRSRDLTGWSSEL